MKVSKLLYTILLLLLFVGCKEPREGYMIVISKQSMTLSLCDLSSNLIFECGVACGQACGNKQRPGDMKTPEGRFYISQIVDASKWTHDFGDGLGEIKGAYGPNFLRLNTPPHKGIGIHGTHLPESIGTRASEGCIRLRNEDLLRLMPYVYLYMPVIVIAGEEDVVADIRMREGS